MSDWHGNVNLADLDEKIIAELRQWELTEDPACLIHIILWQQQEIKALSKSLDGVQAQVYSR